MKMQENKVALITGINGQDGSYLAELLLSKGYEVWGILKRNSVAENQTARLPDHIYEQLNLEYADMLDMSSLIRVLQVCKPDEIYNLAAQSHVRISFDMPIYTAETTGLGPLNLLEAVRLVCKDAKIYQAGSSEMFGNNIDSDGYQRESTHLEPVSPYGCAKVFAHNICKNYRNAYGMFISNGILFNHESERRGIEFVTRKISDGVAKIKLGLADHITLGNLDAERDWGYAPDYVYAMWLMLQQDEPDDFVCSTGVSHTVKDLVSYVFSELDLDWKKYIQTDQKFMRPEELEFLKGDCSKAKEILGWKHKYTFETMLDEMIAYWQKELK